MFDKNLVNEEVKQLFAEKLNAQKMLMNPRTGTVQNKNLWETEEEEEFEEGELVEVKLLGEEWVRVN